MRPRLSTSISVYAVAVLVTAAAVLLRLLLDPWLGDRVPFITLFAAVAVAVWAGGYRAALVTTGLGFLLTDTLFIEPRGSLRMRDTGEWLGLGLFLLTAAVIIGFGEAARKSWRRAEEGGERLATTLASIGDAVIATDVSGRVTLMNPVAASLTGWQPGDALGRPLGEVFRIHDERTGAAVADPVARVLKEGRVVGLANHVVLAGRDGVRRPIDDSAAPILREGVVVGCVLVFRDVTARRKAETTARFLASIVWSSEDAIIAKDTHGVITGWNRAAERLFGYTAEEAIGKPIAMLAPPDRADEMPRILARIRAGEKVEHFDTVRRARDGHLVPISLTVSPIRNEAGEIVGASKICRDISERQRGEEALRREKARLQATLTGIGDAVIVTDCEGRVTLMNPVAQSLTGWRDGAEGRRVSEVFRIVNEETREPAENPVDRAIREGTIVGLANHTLLIARDGSERPIDDSAAPIRDPDGRVAGVVMVFRDVSERRRSEQAFLEADRRKDEFLATLAHELRNPLAPIRNAVQILMMKTPVDADLAWCREVIDRQARHMARLLDDLLDVSRITHNKIELRRERIDLSAVVQNAVETTRPMIDERHQQLKVRLPEAPLPIEADPIRLSQVFSNLLNNASKYSEDGGHVGLSCERRGADVVVSVRDDGMGITSEMLPRIFDLFSQAERGLPRAQGGLGIGLSLARGLVELHGGTLEAKSSGIDRGSEFVVCLPMVGESTRGASRADTDADTDQRRPRTVRRRVLIVDDLKDSADSLAILLSMMGHETHTAYDGEEGVAAAERLRPDAVLLDIGMPKLNGYEACEKIRARPWGKKTLLIAVTGWGQEDDRRRTERAGFDRHLVKPVDPDEVAKILEKEAGDGIDAGGLPGS
jgi:PAS domain S-box-containing protein